MAHKHGSSALVATLEEEVRVLEKKLDTADTVEEQRMAAYEKLADEYEERLVKGTRECEWLSRVIDALNSLLHGNDHATQLATAGQYADSSGKGKGKRAIERAGGTGAGAEAAAVAEAGAAVTGPGRSSASSPASRAIARGPPRGRSSPRRLASAGAATRPRPRLARR